MLQLPPLVKQQMVLESRAAVELVLTVAEEAVVVAQIEAEVEEVVVPPSLTPMDHARRT
jgi:hypothetical protein